MLTGKYEKPTPPPGCVWEYVTIKLYSELEEAYRKGWLVFESFTSDNIDNLGREVTGSFSIELVWSAMQAGRRFVLQSRLVWEGSDPNRSILPIQQAVW